MGQIQRNKIYKTLLKSVKGSLKEVHQMFMPQWKLLSVSVSGVSVLVPVDSSVFTSDYS